MIQVVEPHQAGEFAYALESMHRLRSRVFRDRLGWEVNSVAGREFDRYDALRPTYLLHVGPDGEVDGCARMLPTTGPTMVRDTFPVLLGAHDLRRGPRVWECSRFAVDERAGGGRDAGGLARVTLELMAAELEWALARNLDEIAAVVDVRMEKIMLRAGVRWTRIDKPRSLGVTRALAGYVEVSRGALEALRARAGLSGSVLAPATEVRVAA
jgi:acyl homoserine lactone synthase